MSSRIGRDHQAMVTVLRAAGNTGSSGGDRLLVTSVDDSAERGRDEFDARLSPAGRIGKAVELLVAASCMLSTRGELNVATSLVDDEGVDLVFHRRGGSRTLAVQVKARTSDSKRVRSENVMVFVRASTFRPRPDFDLLVTAVDVANAQLVASWLVPSEVFAANAGPPNRAGRLRFYASLKPTGRDRWTGFRVNPRDLGAHVLARLDAVDRPD